MYIKMNKLIATLFAGLTLGAVGTKLGTQAIDCKNTNCVVETIYDEQGNRGQIKYTADEWNKKSESEIKSDIQKRITEKKKFIEEQSKKISNDEEVI